MSDPKHDPETSSGPPVGFGPNAGHSPSKTTTIRRPLGGRKQHKMNQEDGGYDGPGCT